MELREKGLNGCGGFIRNGCGSFIMNGCGSFIRNGCGSFIMNRCSRMRNLFFQRLVVPPILRDIEVGGELGSPLLSAIGLAVQSIRRKRLRNGVGK